MKKKYILIDIWHTWMIRCGGIGYLRLLEVILGSPNRSFDNKDNLTVKCKSVFQITSTQAIIKFLEVGMQNELSSEFKTWVICWKKGMKSSQLYGDYFVWQYHSGIPSWTNQCNFYSHVRVLFFFVAQICSIWAFATDPGGMSQLVSWLNQLFSWTNSLGSI